MNEKEIIILTSVVSASISVIVSKLFELFQNKQQYRLKLKQEYFLKKLNAFEQSIAFWTTSQSSFYALHMIFKSLLDSDKDFGDGAQAALAGILKWQESITEKTSQGVSALSLYIDLPQEKKELKLIDEFYGLMGQFTPIILQIGETYTKEQDTETQQQRTKLEKALEQKINRMETICSQILVFVNALSSKLRSELKKFDA